MRSTVIRNQMYERQQVRELVQKEQLRQDEKWGHPRTHDLRLWVTVLAEELGEVARADLDKEGPERQIEELTHLAAVAQSAAEDLMRQNESGRVGEGREL